MIAILPLLFSNGHPVALANFTTDELEKFITFMVTCSWGHDTASNILQPPWWPRDVPFSHPFVRPNTTPKNWEEKLKNVVKKCYEFHKSTFLLVFSAQLARHPPQKLRYVDNRDHTTSLYDKPNGKLLVTFRNENLYYDSKPILLDDDDENEIKDIDEDKANNDNVKTVLSDEEPQIKTDIYLCDHCDSHFDNLEVLKAHERLCNNEIPSSTCTGGFPDFLSALRLMPVGLKVDKSVSDIRHKDSDSKPKIVRSAANIERGPPYPFSSLAYTRTIKNVQRDTTYSRERVERYCCTSTLPSKNVAKNKNHFPVRYRRPIDHWHRKHVFPDQRKKKILGVNGQLLLLKCRPITVGVERMSQKEMTAYIENLNKEAQRKSQLRADKDIVFVDGHNYDQPTDVEMKSLDPLKRVDNDCEVIDLCSDDETASVNENCDPRAGVTCVMRGGAVLRRNAATPHAMPSEPCGAREKPLPAAVLQPHPVILIAHTVNKLHTIYLE